MAYFVPDPQTLEALKSAAARGVEVTLLLPSYTDFWAVFHAGRSHYAELLEDAALKNAEAFVRIGREVQVHARFEIFQLGPTIEDPLQGDFQF